MEQAETSEPDGRSYRTSDTPPAREKPGADWKNPECANPGSHDEADLCQQRRMAESAEDAALYALIQTSVASLGFPAIIAALVLNWLAAKAARDAAIAAKEQAIIARSADRPYIRTVFPKVTGFEQAISTEDRILTFTATIENVGRGTAYLEYATCGVAVASDKTIGQHDAVARYIPLEGMTIESGQAASEIEMIREFARFSAGERADIAAGNRDVYYFGRVCYRDIHGVRRSSGYLFWHIYLSRGGDPVPDAIMADMRPNFWTDREESHEERAGYERWRRDHPLAI